MNNISGCRAGQRQTMVDSTACRRRVAGSGKLVLSEAKKERDELTPNDDRIGSHMFSLLFPPPGCVPGCDSTVAVENSPAARKIL